MPTPAFLSRPLDVGMAMGVQDIIRSQETGQDAANRRMGKDLVQLGNSLKDLIPRISFALEYCCCLAIDFFVHVGQVRMHSDVPVGDEVSNPLIIE